MKNIPRKLTYRGKTYSIEVFGFTPRQLELAGYVARGMSQKSICDAMKISIHTLRNYLDKIKQKTNTPSTMECAVVLAYYFPPANYCPRKSS